MYTNESNEVIMSMFKETASNTQDEIPPSIQQILVVTINDKAMECPGMLSEEKVINECESGGGQHHHHHHSAAAAYLKTKTKNKLLQQQLSIQSGGSSGGGGGGGAVLNSSSGGVKAKKHGVGVISGSGPVVVGGGGHVNKRGKYSSSGKQQQQQQSDGTKTSKSNSIPDDQDDFLDSSFDPSVVVGPSVGSEPGAARLIKVPSEIGMDDARSRHDGSVG